MKTLLVITAATLLLVGCATSPHRGTVVKFPNSPNGYTVYQGNNPYHAHYIVIEGDWAVINGYLIRYNIKPMNTNATDIWIPVKDINIIVAGADQFTR